MALTLMKGSEAIAEAAIRAGARFFFGYPITPQTEIPEYMSARMPEIGGCFLQAESEVAAINMVYGAAGTGARVITSSSSPGVSLKQEGISYCAGARVPAVIVNVMRGGPGLGTIQPSQSDYFQATKGGAHGDFHLIVLAPNSVQEMHDFVFDAFDLAFKYRNPVMILSDGVIGQMMEKVGTGPTSVRAVPQKKSSPRTAIGPDRQNGRQERTRHHVARTRPVCTGEVQREAHRQVCKIRENEVRYEEFMTEDADYIIVAFGSAARICRMTVEMAREAGYKVGLVRPITLYPFPSKVLHASPQGG